jgi:hypothetical protein
VVRRENEVTTPQTVICSSPLEIGKSDKIPKITIITSLSLPLKLIAQSSLVRVVIISLLSSNPSTQNPKWVLLLIKPLLLLGCYHESNKTVEKDRIFVIWISLSPSKEYSVFNLI